MAEYRVAKPEEVDEVTRLTDIIFRESRDIAPSMGRQFPTLLTEDNASGLYIAKEDGKVVSHIGIKENPIILYGHKISMASMGAVCTHQDYQGRGIATKLLYETFDSLHERQISLLTISGGRGLYRRNGAVESMGTTDFNIKERLDIPECSDISYRILDDKDDISSIAQTYYREPIRYERRRKEFNILFKAKPMVLEPDKVPFIAAIAYNKTHSFENGIAYVLGFKTGENVFNVIEYAGERSAILGIINAVLEETKSQSISIQIPKQDSVLISMLESLSLAGSDSGSGRTVRIVNKETLWEEIYPIIKESWEGADIPRSLSDLPSDVVGDIGLLTSFIFGEMNRAQYGEKWDRIFPLPLPYYRGLNYI